MRFVLVGLGRMGRNHLRVLNSTPGIGLAAIVEPSASPDEKISGAPCVRTLDELEHVSFDAAVVASPTPTHFDVASALIRAGKHVLVEKPIASSVRDGRALVSLARKAGVRLAVGHLERLNPAVQCLRGVICEGKIGRPIHYAFTRAGGYPATSPDGNNVILDLAVHDIDVFRMLEGRSHVVHAHAHATVNRAVLDTAEIALRSSGGASANIHVNWNTPTKLRTLRVTGTEGVCFVDYVAQTCEFVRGGVARTADYQDMRASYARAERVLLDVESREPLRVQFEQVVEFFDRGDSGCLCTGEDALAAVSLAERAMTLADEGYV